LGSTVYFTPPISIPRMEKNKSRPAKSTTASMPEDIRRSTETIRYEALNKVSRIVDVAKIQRKAGTQARRDTKQTVDMKPVSVNNLLRGA
jgi:hypothetical protein